MSIDNSHKDFKNKTICFVIPNWATSRGTGGAELQCYYLSEELIARGWKVEVISEKKDKSITLVNKNFFNEQISFKTFKRSKFNLITFFRIFLKLISSQSTYYYNRTDAILLRGTCGLYCKLFSKQMIFALANDSDIINKKLASKYISVPKKNLITYIRLLDSKLADKITNKYVFSAKYTLSQTNFQKKLILEKFGIESTLIRNSFIPSNLNHTPKENIILWVSNIRPQKQPQLLKDLIEKLDLGNWQVVLIGNYSGYEHIIDQIKHPNFKATGSLAFEEVLKWLNKSKILINTSSSEGFPNSFIQAWFYKLLVISYSFDPDKLIKQKGIAHCSEGNFTNFVETVQDHIDGKEADEICSKAYEFANEEFDLKKNIERFLVAIEAV